MSTQPKINLTDEELKQLSEAINNSTEPPYEIIGKLFPSFLEKLRAEGKLDVEAMNKYKVATLEYAGKRPEGIILASASLLGQSAPLQVVRKFGNTNDNEWNNLIVQGDNLQFLKTVYLNQDPLIKDKVKGKIKLVYIDPPFGTGDEYGGSDGEMSYSAKIKGSEFIEGLRERLVYLREILSKGGTIFLRIDYRFQHYLKVILDEIFSKDNFINEIIIGRKRQSIGSGAKFEIQTECLLFYSKSNWYIDNFSDVFKSRAISDFRWTGFLKQGERHPKERIFLGVKMNPPKGQHFTLNKEKVKKLIEENFLRLRCKKCKAIYYYDESESRDNFVYNIYKSRKNKFKYLDINSESLVYGVQNITNCLNCEGSSFRVQYLPSNKIKINNIWLDMVSYSDSVGYPTENSEQLLERIIKASSNPDDLVLDCFAGSGTTAAVAEKLGRRWIMCDFGKHAIYTMQKRIFNIAGSKALGEENKGKKYSKSPKPFKIVSVGAYDFTRVMNLRKNKEAYISFVLALFGIPKEDKNFIDKYKLDGIYAEKDGNPVEIFPIWDDEYLYNIRVDEDYLKEIIIQSRRRLKGNYYIIVPETCSIISDTKMQNNYGDDIYFKLLKFPYKILEEIARNFEIEEQPDSPANINNFISSVGFYFNNNVNIDLEIVDGGFKIKDFKTMILDKERKLYKNLDGLSLLLVDLEYNGKVFNMDKAMYAKEVKEDGIVKLDGISNKSAIIAIDKHGNESESVYISKRNI